MSLVEVKHPGSKNVLGLWKIEEELGELTGLVRSYGCNTKELESISHDTRKKQWLATRATLCQLLPGEFGEISKDRYGKPFLSHSPCRLSLSHSGHFVAVILNETAQTGIDIQEFNPKIERIKNKFATEKERKLKGSGDDAEHLHLIWGVKESIYKWYGKKELLFKKHMEVRSVENKGENKLIKAQLKLNGRTCQFRLIGEKIENYILVYILK